MINLSIYNIGVNENQTVRTYLSTLTYSKQFDIGIEILKLLEIL